MKGTRHSEEQIITILKQGEAGKDGRGMRRAEAKVMALNKTAAGSQCASFFLDGIKDVQV